MDLEDALDCDPSNTGATNPKPGQLGHQGPQPGFPGTWPGQPGQPGQQGPWPGQSGQPGPWPGQPGQPGPWPGQPGQPGQPGPWPGQPGQPGPWPGQPGQPGPWPGQPGQPGPWPGQPGQPGPGPKQPGQPRATASTLNVPYDFPLREAWTPFKMLTVDATIKMNADKFTIDVYSGQNIVFHLNVRFKEDGHNQAIVRNSRVKNVWGAEERSIPYFPFKEGEKFNLLILGDPNQFKVAMNKQHLIIFKHKLKNLNEVTKINIYGDIILHNVAML
ncbi:galectin-3-like isoform X2 [Narcine bancroftii]|uniref:galectin-3-like isoform X2 n=1 Tax=Narcine bancroftii TaxID=1343680 RepID=UPI003831EA03